MKFDLFLSKKDEIVIRTKYFDGSYLLEELKNGNLHIYNSDNGMENLTPVRENVTVHYPSSNQIELVIKDILPERFI